MVKSNEIGQSASKIEICVYIIPIEGNDVYERFIKI
nr:MAG TPA: hypothetical protein [Caudoviricetes sp.]